MAHPQEWLKVTSTGLYCAPGDFYIDPALPVERAVVTHGHSDHARPGHRHVLATAGTLAIMGARFGTEAATRTQAAAYGESVRIGDVSVRLAPAGHVLGSAQVVLEHGGSRVVISGDYKRRPDPTCAAFEPVSAMSSLLRRLSACRCFAIRRMTARSTACSTRCGCFPSAATSSACMRSASASG
jgi:putative mRNA 3-end processing factor